jgi:hypothetical protein
MAKKKDITAAIMANSWTDDELKLIAGQIADLDDGNTTVEHVFTQGIVKPDEIGAVIQVAPDRIGDVVSSIAAMKNPKTSIRIFPVGILAPEKYRVELKVNSGGAR